MPHMHTQILQHISKIFVLNLSRSKYWRVKVNIIEKYILNSLRHKHLYTTTWRFICIRMRNDIICVCLIGVVWLWTFAKNRLHVLFCNRLPIFGLLFLSYIIYCCSRSDEFYFFRSLFLLVDPLNITHKYTILSK